MRNFKQIQNLKSWDAIAKYCHTDIDKICHKKNFKEFVCKHILNYSGYKTDKYNFLYENSTFCTIISQIFEFLKKYKVKLNNTDQYYLNVEKNEYADIIENHKIDYYSRNFTKELERFNELKNFLNFNNYKFELTPRQKPIQKYNSFSFDNKIDVLEL